MSEVKINVNPKKYVKVKKKEDFELNEFYFKDKPMIKILNDDLFNEFIESKIQQGRQEERKRIDEWLKLHEEHYGKECIEAPDFTSMMSSHKLHFIQYMRRWLEAKVGEKK